MHEKAQFLPETIPVITRLDAALKTNMTDIGINPYRVFSERI